MKLLPADATDEQLMGLAREWIELMADDRVDEALALLWTPPDYPQESQWTPATLRSRIENYGWVEPLADGRRFRITSQHTARPPVNSPGYRQYAEVVRLLGDDRVGSVTTTCR